MGTIADANAGLAPARRLLTVATAYAGVAIAGILLSFAYGVGAEPGGEWAADLPVRGTAFAAPLFVPVVLLAAAAVARGRGLAAAAAIAVAGLAGAALLLGGTLNLPTDLDAARAADAPAAFSVVFGLVSAATGLVLLAQVARVVAASLRGRAR